MACQLGGSLGCEWSRSVGPSRGRPAGPFGTMTHGPSSTWESGRFGASAACPLLDLLGGLLDIDLEAHRLVDDSLSRS